METVIIGGLEGTFFYLDNIAVCGITQKEHDVNLKKFLEPIERKKSHIYNESKSVFSTKKI